MAARRPRHMEKLVVTPQLNSRPARPEAAHTLESAGIHPLLARQWAARGITDANQAKLNWPAMIPPGNLTNSEYETQLLTDPITSRHPLPTTDAPNCPAPPPRPGGRA